MKRYRDIDNSFQTLSLRECSVNPADYLVAEVIHSIFPPAFQKSLLSIYHQNSTFKSLRASYYLGSAESSTMASHLANIL